MQLRSWFIVVATCVLVAAGLGYFKYQQIQSAIAMNKNRPEPVEVVEMFVARDEFYQPTASVTAETVAVRAVEVSNELAGRIVEIGFAATTPLGRTLTIQYRFTL